MKRTDVDSEALAALHEQAFRWSVFCCAFDEDAARDVLQTVYLQILEGRARFAGRSTLRTWLFAVIKHTAAGQRRADRRHPAAGTEGIETAPDSGEQQAMADGTRRLLADCLARLPARQRAVVELVYYHELTVKECGAVLSISTGSAARHLHRAKRTLAASLEMHKGALSYAG